MLLSFGLFLGAKIVVSFDLQTGNVFRKACGNDIFFIGMLSVKEKFCIFAVCLRYLL